MQGLFFFKQLYCQYLASKLLPLTWQCSTVSEIWLTLVHWVLCIVETWSGAFTRPPEAHTIPCPQKVVKMDFKSTMFGASNGPLVNLWTFGNSGQGSAHDSPKIEASCEFDDMKVWPQKQIATFQWKLLLLFVTSNEIFILCNFKKFAAQLHPQIHYLWTNLGSNSPQIC